MFEIAIKLDSCRALRIIRSLLCCAFEGGSNYWYDDLRPLVYPEGKTAEDYRERGSQQPEDEYWHWCQLLPTTGGVIAFRDKEDGTDYQLSQTACVNGLTILANKYPRHLADALTDNTDADTGDAFLQCCLFGEVRFG